MTLTAEQVALRKQGLGGSEIGAVAGIHPYKTPLDVYMAKLGLVEDQENPFMEWGTRLEPALIQAYAEKTRAGGYERPGTILHPAEGWALATPDALILRHEGDRHGLETKCRNVHDSHRWGESGTDEVPDEVAAQAHWGMLITGLRRWDVAVLLGGNDFRVYELRFDEAISANLWEIGRAFWHDHVLKEVPPPIDGSEQAHRFLARRYPNHSDRMVAATEQHADLAARLEMVTQARKEAEEAESRLKALFKEAIGEYAGIQGQGWKVTWKRTKDSQHVEWEKVARDLLEIVKQRGDEEARLLAAEAFVCHTSTRPGSRRFLSHFNGRA